MIRREQECCAFLDFELSENEKGLTLAITAPESVRDTVDALFGPFLTGAGGWPVFVPVRWPRDDRHGTIDAR
jgi:hypothetical protein